MRAIDLSEAGSAGPWVECRIHAPPNAETRDRPHGGLLQVDSCRLLRKVGEAVVAWCATIIGPSVRLTA